MRMVSIDISTKCLAYAFWIDDQLVDSARLFPTGSGDEAIGSITSIIIDEFEGGEIDLVVYEAASPVPA